MKKILLLTTLFILVLTSANSAFAKKTFDENTPSVQLLKTLTSEGNVIRQNDAPIEKADIEADCTRVKALKKIYNDALLIPVVKEEKNPIENQSGIFE